MHTFHTTSQTIAMPSYVASSTIQEIPMPPPSTVNQICRKGSKVYAL